jgi:uncharacterized LabA/DUF88 family protein
LSDLKILVDYDNVSPNLKVGGPVTLAKILAKKLKTELFYRHTSITVRIYGGWRSKKGLTQIATNLKLSISKESPAVIQYENEGVRSSKRLIVELAEMPIGTSVQLKETYVKDRNIRKFRAKEHGWDGCENPSGCGFKAYEKINHSTQCPYGSCKIALEDVFVRDEQKMVDTLIVADIAKLAFSGAATDIVIVSSDVDMWPGVLLALNAGCSVTHFHTALGASTQRHLLETLSRGMDRKYEASNL